MKNFYLKVALALACSSACVGLNAQSKTDTLFVQAADTVLTGEIQCPVVFKNKTSVKLDKAILNKDVIVAKGADVTFAFSGKNVISANFVNQGKAVWTKPAKEDGEILVRSLKNEGFFEDLTATVEKVGGSLGFEISKVWATASGKLNAKSYFGANFVGSISDESEVFPEVCLQRLNEADNTWVDFDKAPKGTKGNLRSANEFTSTETFEAPGKYRYKVVGEGDTKDLATILYSRTLVIEEIAENVEWKERVVDAVSICPKDSKQITVSFDDVKVRRLKSEHGAVVVPGTTNVVLNLKGDNSSLDSLYNQGNLLLTNDGNARLQMTMVVNEGVFRDTTGTINKVYGTAGIWVDTFFVENKDTIGNLPLTKVGIVYYKPDFKVKTDVYLEVLKEGKWQRSETEKNDNALRSSDLPEGWSAKATTFLQLSASGLYRVKFNAMKDNVTTVLYSRPFSVNNSTPITNEQTSIGENDKETKISSLLIQAGKKDSLVNASLTNVSVGSNDAGVASVVVASGSNVALQLNGKNNLGDIEVQNGASLILKPAEGVVPGKSESKQTIRSVRNGGQFVDETATVSSVKDLNNVTMIELKDTVEVLIDNIMNVSVKAVAGELSGYVLGGDATEIWDVEANKWVPYGQVKAASEYETSLVVMLAVSKEGLYRIKLESESLDDDNLKASLYFVHDVKIPTSNVEVEANDTRIWSDGNTVHVYTSQKANVKVFTFQGVLAYQQKDCLGEQAIQLPM